jgi:hypothetical protein
VRARLIANFRISRREKSQVVRSREAAVDHRAFNFNDLQADTIGPRVARAEEVTTSMIIAPPFTEEAARRKVQLAEDSWNTRDPERVCLAYSVDSEWRNRADFLRGREEIKAFLRRKWAKELDYRLKKTLWAFRDNRIAVTFEYEWHDQTGQWFRSYGNELWEFDAAGLMSRRIASINDAPIEFSDRRTL